MPGLLVVRLGSLGDLVHALPAVAALREAHPDRPIDWLVDAVHRPLLARVPVVSSVVTLRDRTARAWLAARAELSRRHYDVAVDFQGLIKSAMLARLSGARHVAGFARDGLREPAAAVFYSKRVPGGEGGHVIQKNLKLAASLGAAAGPLRFPIRVDDSPVVDTLAGLGGAGFAIINPGAAWPNKRWPPDRFGQVAAAIRERHGLVPVVLWGPGERAIADAVVAASNTAAVLAPETTLDDLVDVMARARLVVSGDTGPTHIAGAFGVPIVALFGPTDASRNGPWDPADVTLGDYAACSCHYERRCRREPADWCLAAIGVADVVSAIARRLQID